VGRRKSRVQTTLRRRGDMSSAKASLKHRMKVRISKGIKGPGLTHRERRGV